AVGVGRWVGRRFLSRNLPARRHVGTRRGAVRRAGVRRGADVGRHHPKRRARVRLPLCVLARHDGTPGRGRTVLRRAHHIAEGGDMDGLDQKSCRRGSTADGRILLRQSGASLVKPCVVRRASFVALLLLVPAVVRGQDVIGIPVGEKPPAVTLENLNGDSVALAKWIGKKPVIVEFWATWCPICAELLPRMEAAQKKYGDSVAFLVVAVAVNQSK